MIDQFVDEAKKEIGEKLKANFQLDETHISNMFRLTKTTLQDQIKVYVFKGKLNEVLNIFIHNNQSSTLLADIGEKLVKDFEQKLSIPSNQSQTIVNFLLPEIVTFFQTKFKASGESQDIKGLSKFLGLGHLGSIFSIFK